MRLQKFLSQAGVASRRHAEEMIASGRVKVNGRVVKVMGVQVDPQKDRVEVDGRPVSLESKKVYLLLYKPEGYVTTAFDPQGRPKVIDLVRDVPQRVFPVGRLDYRTEGLLLLTNDGDLALKLTHPRYGIPKTYLALVKGVPGAEKIERLRRGVELEDGCTAPARVRLVKIKQGNALLELTLREGKKREVRRMCAAVGHPVLKLKRVKFAFLTLGSLRPGQYRHLTPEEVRRLKEIALHQPMEGR
ncbi:MAG: rRNA synthase [Clostridia bacterium]|nr:rRNA synthase [Clostridia bacterium]